MMHFSPCQIDLQLNVEDRGQELFIQFTIVQNWLLLSGLGVIKQGGTPWFSQVMMRQKIHFFHYFLLYGRGTITSFKINFVILKRPKRSARHRVG